MLLTSVLLYGSSLALTQTSYTVNGTTYQSDDQLPTNPEMLIGELENGLNYYIRENQEPPNRARLGLVVDAASLLEEDNQQGIAHFLEHMMFNGTASFSGNEIIDYTRSIGMDFGPHLNAYTSFDETVYFFEFPMDDPQFLDTGIQILKEWASEATLDIEEIDKERGVVIEEERLRDQNLNGRLSKAIIPFRYGDSRFAERIPIGKLDILETAPREAFMSYYKTWYRPDLMAVIAVGDFDASEIEAKIIEAFSPLTNPDNPQPRTRYEVPIQEGTRYLVIEDPEMPVVQAQISLTSQTEDLVTFDNYRDMVLGFLFTDMFNLRLEEKSREENPPFIFSQISASNLTRRTSTVDFTFVTEESQKGLEAGFKGMYEEINRESKL